MSSPQAARAGLAEGLQPTLAKAGTGGSYFLQDVQGKPVAVFKPEDEEPHAVNNPKGRTGGSSDGSSSCATGSEGLRRGTRPGEGAVREVAAYVLDHDHLAGGWQHACGTHYYVQQAAAVASSLVPASVLRLVPEMFSNRTSGNPLNNTAVAGMQRLAAQLACPGKQLSCVQHVKSLVWPPS